MRALSAPLTGLLLVSTLGLAACGSSNGDKASSAGTTTTSSGTTTTSSGTTTTSSGACSYPTDGQAAKKVSTPPTSPLYNGPVQATIKLGTGDVPVTLDGKGAPCTVNSFESLAKQKYFDGTRCHRLVTAGIYVLQCGDPTGTGSGGPGYSYGPIENAPADNVYKAGTIAMARQGNNAESQGSQFFIVYEDTTIPSDQAGGYTVIGHVTSGLDELKKQVTDKGIEGGKTDGAPAVKTTIDRFTLQ